MAASSVIGALRISLGLDSAQFERGATSAEKRAQAMGNRIGAALRSPITAANALKGAIGALAGTLAVRELAAAATRGLEYASSLGEVSQQLGVTTRDLQEYRYVATQVGVSQDEMDKALARLTLTMGKARAGVAGPKQAFAELSNILGRDILKNAATAGDAIPLIADALSKVSDPARRAAFEVEFFGKTGQRLDTLLAGGSEAVNRLRSAAQSLGLVLSDEQIQTADDTADKLAEVKTVLEANIASAVANNAGAILALADAFATLVVKAGQAMEAVSNFNNLQGFKQGSNSAGETLAKTKSGRVVLLNYLDERLQQNSKDRSTGRGNRTSYLGGLIETTTGADAASNAKLDSDFKQLNRVRNAVQTIDARAARGKPARRVSTTGAGAGTSAGDAASTARSAAEDAKRHAAEQNRLAEEALQKERQFQSELYRSKDEIQSLEADLTVEAYERAQLERDRIKHEKEYNQAAIQADKDLNEPKKQMLSDLQERNAKLRTQLVYIKETEAMAREELETARTRADNETDVLQAQGALARTAKQRGEIELKLLAIQFDHLRFVQRQILEDENATAAQKANARSNLATFDKTEALATQRVNRDNQGPLGQFLDGLPQNAEEANEAMQRVAVDGIEGITDGLSDAVTGARTLADVFKNVADQIIKSLIRIAVQKAIVGSLSNLLGGSAGSGVSFESASAGMDSAFASLSGARANGGPVIGGRSYLVGERGMEIFKPTGSGDIVANDNLGGGRGVTVQQSLTFSGAVDLATRTEVYRVADAARQAAINGVMEANRRRG